MSDLIPFHRPSFQHAATSLRSLIMDVCETLEEKLLARKLAVEVDVPGTLFLPVDRAWLRGILREMLETAAERSPENSEIHVSAHTGRRGVEIEVADWGELADSSSQSENSPGSTPTRTLPSRKTVWGPMHAKYQKMAHLAAMQNAAFSVLRCPEGGMASSLTIGPRWNEAAA